MIKLWLYRPIMEAQDSDLGITIRRPATTNEVLNGLIQSHVCYYCLIIMIGRKLDGTLDNSWVETFSIIWVGAGFGFLFVCLMGVGAMGHADPV